MPPDPIDHLVTTLAAGFGLTLVGLLNLVAGRSAVLVRVAGAILISAAAVAAVVLWVGAASAGVPAGVVLAAGLVPAAALGSRRVLAIGTWVARRATRPTGRWGLATAAGLAAVAIGVARFDADQEARIERDARVMNWSGGSDAQAVIGEHVPAQTDRGARLVVGLVVAPRGPADLRDAEEHYLRDYLTAPNVLRREPPDDRSNCHGWVFAAGRYHVPGRVIEQIIADNDYRPVAAPRTGDLVVYRDTARVTHTAVVRYVTVGMPVLVEGKWGNLGVFLHAVDKSCYGKEYTYLRSPRVGHTLAGLGSAGTPRPVAGG